MRDVRVDPRARRDARRGDATRDDSERDDVRGESS
jgi:hypothetical protein